MSERKSNDQPRFVRVREIRPNGYVEFDFSIASPELSAKLILPEQAFWEFFTANSVHFISEQEAASKAPLRERGL